MLDDKSPFTELATMWKIKRSTRFVQVALIPVLLIGWAMLFACGYSLMFNESLQL